MQDFHVNDKKIPLVSIVTVCLNAQNTIEKTLQSVASQNYSNVEHVLVDGGSLDDTVKIIKQYKPSLLVSEKDEGIYYAMQKGVGLSSGDILFFLNSGDMFFNENTILDVVKFFDLVGCDAVFGNLLPYYLSPEDTHDHNAFQNNKLMDFSYFNNRSLFYDESIHHQTVFYSREIFSKCGFICDDHLANGEYFLHLSAFIKRKYTLKHFPFPVCKFALGGKSTSNFALEWKNFSYARDTLRKIFFPTGPISNKQNANEYLYYPPSIKSKIKIYSRKFGFHQLLMKINALRLFIKSNMSNKR